MQMESELATAVATPAMSQEATQEPGMIGYTYPNSDYLLGGYGVRTPSRYDYSYLRTSRLLRSRARWACGWRSRRCGRNGGCDRGRAVR
jgi:hypothetical protein